MTELTVKGLHWPSGVQHVGRTSHCSKENLSLAQCLRDNLGMDENIRRNVPAHRTSNFLLKTQPREVYCSLGNTTHFLIYKN